MEPQQMNRWRTGVGVGTSRLETLLVIEAFGSSAEVLFVFCYVRTVWYPLK